MKKKMSNRDKKILLIFGAILILAASYFLVHNNLKTKTETLVAENAELDAEVTRLENMFSHKDTVSESTTKIKDRIEKKLENFPLEVRTQNIIAELHNMSENEIKGVKIQSESYKMNQIFYQNAAEAQTEGVTQIVTGVSIKADTPSNVAVDAASGYVGYRSDVVVGFTAKYSDVQAVIDYINSAENRMTITDLAVTKDVDSEELICNMTVSMYAISGTSLTYQQPEDVEELGNVSEQKNGIFGK